MGASWDGVSGRRSEIGVTEARRRNDGVSVTPPSHEAQIIRRIRRTLMNVRPLLGLASILVGAGAVAAPAPQPSPAAPRVLAIVISVDGLSWDRLVYYRPWYVAGLKRLLDESQ